MTCNVIWLSGIQWLDIYVPYEVIIMRWASPYLAPYLLLQYYYAMPFQLLIGITEMNILIEKSACITMISMESPGNVMIEHKVYKAYGHWYVCLQVSEAYGEHGRYQMCSFTHWQGNLDSQAVQAVLLPLNVLLNIVWLAILTTGIPSLPANVYINVFIWLIENRKLPIRKS